uniref:Uncharacterized protein n=1 Tax=Lepeophtheirus salmonis TaxID=72036 RepID=A0A0K2UTP6_LEPSM
MKALLLLGSTAMLQGFVPPFVWEENNKVHPQVFEVKIVSDCLSGSVYSEKLFPYCRPRNKCYANSSLYRK